jgi:hypothetical protein
LRTAYPCSSYEFACARASPSYCVRKSHLSLRFSMIWRYRFVRSVPVRIREGCSTVAVNPLEQTPIANLITSDNRGVAGVCTGLASPGYLSRFLFSALPCVAPYCVRGGVRSRPWSLLLSTRVVRSCVRFWSCTRRHQFRSAGIDASRNAEIIETSQSGYCRSIPWLVRYEVPQSSIAP